LTTAAMRVVLGCASPCKVSLAKIIEHLSQPATKAARAAAKLLKTPAEVIAALPAGMRTSKILAYLEEYPALMKLITEAELTAPDLAKMSEFLTAADKVNPATAYRTFTRYLTFAASARTEGDIGKLNKIAAALLEADARQGSALKGAMFEIFARVHLQEFAGKAFRRVRFRAGAGLELATESRTSDFFIEATGELWDFKHAASVDAAQARDYAKILNSVSEGLPRVQSINYLFPSKAWAVANRSLADTAGFFVHYVDEAGKVVTLL
jgi:hypothetical protein